MNPNLSSKYILEFCTDGNQICVTRGDFINLQESCAGFGDTVDEAIRDLLQNEWLEAQKANAKQKEGL